MPNTYTTGQASGITEIPIRTMQDYVQDFRECFSETARQPLKGRRFTDADIDALRTIREMREDRESDDDIRKVLTGEVQRRLAHKYEESKVRQMAVRFMEVYEKAMETQKDYERMLRQAYDEMGKIREENRQIRADTKTWNDRVNKFRRWQIWVMKNFEQLNPYGIESGFEDEEEPRPITQDGQEIPRKKILGIF